MEPEDKKEEIQVPSVNLNINLPTETGKNEIVEASQIVGLCKEVLDDIRVDSNEIHEAYGNFAEMVFNSGDATAASKEALVNLLKLKSDIADKKTRVMEMMLRAYMKDNRTNLTANQHNEIRIEDNSKRDLLQSLEKKSKKEK
jgi:hypothetical protein